MRLWNSLIQCYQMNLRNLTKQHWPFVRILPTVRRMPAKPHTNWCCVLRITIQNSHLYKTARKFTFWIFVSAKKKGIQQIYIEMKITSKTSCIFWNIKWTKQEEDHFFKNICQYLASNVWQFNCYFDAFFHCDERWKSI